MSNDIQETAIEVPEKKVLERTIRKRFRKKCTEAGYTHFKFTSGVTGVPDEIIIVPGNPARIILVELKRPVNGHVKRRQDLVLSGLSADGVEAYVCNTKLKVDELFKDIAANTPVSIMRDKFKVDFRQ